MRHWWLLLLFLGACEFEFEGFERENEGGGGYGGGSANNGGGGGGGGGNNSSGLPSSPAHSRMRDGVAHADGLGTPFLCVDPYSGQHGPCPIGRPAPEDLSCDAAGCHGSNDYTNAPDVGRNLNGDQGPSCYDCHGQLWSARVQ